jgi:hypothetical protein
MFSKNGSIPKPETDGTKGWIEVPNQPECPAGKEVVWWFPPGWIVRDLKPEGNWSWSQSEEQWIEYVPQVEQIQSIDSQQIQAIDSHQFGALSSQDIGAL